MVAARVVVALFAVALVAACSDSPAEPTFTVGGTVYGLSSAGLILQNNGGNDHAIASGGTFTLSGGNADGSAYNVTLLTQPAYQNCTVNNGSGTIASANVTNVTVTCTTPTVTVGGTVTGLSGAGLVIQNNGANNLAIAASGNFTFSPALASGSGYSVTVLNFPTNQNCIVSNGSGTVGKNNVTNVVVGCFSPFAQHQVVTASATTGAVGALGNISVTCPGTKNVLGGGYRSASATEVWRVWRSRPVDAGGTQAGNRGWGVSFTSAVAGQDVTVHAICADPAQNMGYEVLNSSVVTGPVGTAGTVFNICGGAKRTVGGGYSSEVSTEVWRPVKNRGVDAGGVQTAAMGWAVDFISMVAGQNVSVHAICAQAPADLGGQTVTTNVLTGAVGSVGTVSAICPGTKRVLGGGFISSGAADVWRVWRSYPVDAGVQVGDRGWAVDFTSVVAGQTVTAFAVCGFAPTT